MGKETKKLTPWSWEATGAFCCFAGGIGAAIVGSVLTALTWILGGELHPWVRGVGTGFLLLTIPLLIMAGYCLDWLESKLMKPSSARGSNEAQQSAPSSRMRDPALRQAAEMGKNVEIELIVQRLRRGVHDG